MHFPIQPVRRTPFQKTEITKISVKQHMYIVSARPEFLGVIGDPLFENLGVNSKLRGSELF